MNEKIEKKELAILRALDKSPRPLTSSRLLDNLRAMGYEVSERTIRHYFQDLDRRGLTENFGKRGRAITDLGREELGRLYRVWASMSPQVTLGWATVASHWPQCLVPDLLALRCARW